MYCEANETDIKEYEPVYSEPDKTQQSPEFKKLLNTEIQNLMYRITGATTEINYCIEAYNRMKRNDTFDKGFLDNKLRDIDRQRKELENQVITDTDKLDSYRNSSHPRHSESIQSITATIISRDAQKRAEFEENRQKRLEQDRLRQEKNAERHIKDKERLANIRGGRGNNRYRGNNNRGNNNSRGGGNNSRGGGAFRGGNQTSNRGGYTNNNRLSGIEQIIKKIKANDLANTPNPVLENRLMDMAQQLNVSRDELGKIYQRM